MRAGFFSTFLEELEARTAIEDCLKRFARAVDRQDWKAAREAYQHAVSAGTHSAFLLGAVVAVLVLAAAIFVKEVPLRGGPQKAGESDEAAPMPVVEAV